MTRYECQVLAEFEAAVEEARMNLARFLAARREQLEKAGGGSVDGCKTVEGVAVAFIAFAWGEVAQEAADKHRDANSRFETIPAPIKETIQ